MMPRRRSRAFVEDILNAIGNIEADTEGLDFSQFVADRRIRQLVERNIEIISEASRRLPDDDKAAEADIPWREIAGIGNIIRHDYGIVRPDILWGVLTQRLAPLKRAMERLRERDGD
jgi:uncharacterized protein with HEPN domain